MKTPYQQLTPDEMHHEQIKQRSVGRIHAALLGTSAWGIMEVMLLRTLGHIAKIFPNVHQHFMRFLHGRFGGVVTPFENALESDPYKRSWETRNKWEKIKPQWIHDPRIQTLQKGDVTILPTEEILNLVMRANLRPTVSYCFCRMYAKEKGHECELHAPIRTCLTLSIPESVDTIASSDERPDLALNQKVLYNMLKKCDEIGLVHQVTFIPSPNYTYVLCNCCPDCCEVLGGFRKEKKLRDYHRRIFDQLENNRHLLQTEISAKKSDSRANRKRLNELNSQIKYHQKAMQLPISPLEVRSAFIAQTTDPAACINCGKCAQRCYFDSRFMAHNQLHFDADHCYGCGLCVTTCPKNIITLVKRDHPVLMAQPGQGIVHVHPHQTSGFDHQH